ncbi:MAG: T9SS type A sorting domain-containing protein [Bacteroidetes bacterium]|nr:T9SS type A sorting domain-containing protein [Bacteroidota bacterium]MBS1930702.1 T9SS type A sorting domain-containing protein [Bacteroidota bacterium]
MKIFLLPSSIILLFQFSSYGQISGPVNGGTFTVVAIPGSTQTWVNPGNVAASDNVYASFGSITTANAYTDYLVVTNFGFAIPGGSTITGIVVEVERSDVNFRTIDNSVKIVKGGIIGGDEKAVSATYPLTDTYQQYGNAGDLWGLAWTDADINASNFGMAVSAKKINSPSGAATGKIDDIRITVYYNFVVLPVNLISFSASKNNKSVSLNWTTANEINMTAYEVQRSADGTNFAPIASVPSQNIRSLTQYNFDDPNPPGNILFYRLKMIGISGYTKYSKIVSVNFSSGNKISLYPNPVSTNQILHIADRNGQLLNIRFFDMAGRMLSNMIINSDDISLSSLRNQKGVVVFQVTDSKFQIIANGKLLVQ